jgi:hypothetical protein
MIAIYHASRSSVSGKNLMTKQNLIEIAAITSARGLDVFLYQSWLKREYVPFERSLQ